MNLNIMKEETLQGILKQSTEIKAYTEIIAKGATVDSWEAAQTFVKNGMGSKIFPTAAQLTMTDTSGTAWDLDVLGNDEDEPVDTSISHVLSLQFHNVFAYGSIPFDPSQYLFAVTSESLAWLGVEGTELPAGTYHVTGDHSAYGEATTEDGTFQFTTTKPVPIGGGIRHSSIGQYHSSGYDKSNVLNGTFMTYGADRVATIESGLATTEGDGGTSLGTTTARNPQYKEGDYINFSERQFYGSNRWLNSFMRQQLNSDEAVMTWTPMTIWSRPMNTLPEGFLHKIDPALKAVLCKVRTRYAKSIADGYGYEDVEDYVKLPTMLDLNFGNNNSIAEGPVDVDGNVTRTTPYSLYVGATNDDRIKYQGTTARSWWLGSASPWNGNIERYVKPDGSLSNSAHDADGEVPSLYIG